MPVVTQTRLQTSVFLAACGICSQPQPMVSHGILHSHFGKPGAALLKKGGLEPAANLNSVSAPNGDEDIEVDVVAMGNGKFGYWGDAGWVEIDPDLLRQYSLSFIWFLRWISDSLQISKRVDAKEILSNRVWFIGDAKFDRQTIPVFFARQIQSSQVIGALRQELKAAHKGKAVIILTSASTLDPIDISHDTKIITLPDFLENSEYLKIDRQEFKLCSAAQCRPMVLAADFVQRVSTDRIILLLKNKRLSSKLFTMQENQHIKRNSCLCIQLKMTPRVYSEVLGGNTMQRGM
jgi:hypothetical protein